MRKILCCEDFGLKMTEKEAIEHGKTLVELHDEEIESLYRRPPFILPDKAYEIIGITGASCSGHTTLSFFKSWEKSTLENPVYLRYKNNKLEECTWRQALSTPEYRKHRIFIFGTTDDVNNDNGDMVYEAVYPELVIIDGK